jgi:beta-lactamase class A
MPREVGQRSEFRVCADNERFPAQSAFAVTIPAAQLEAVLLLAQLECVFATFGD